VHCEGIEELAGRLQKRKKKGGIPALPGGLLDHAQSEEKGKEATPKKKAKCTYPKKKKGIVT